MSCTPSRMFVPQQPEILSHPSELVPGDKITLGKRAWIYVRRTAEVDPAAPGQNEYVFRSEGDGPGAIGPVERTYSQSEIEALSEAGCVSRMVWRSVRFDANMKVSR